MSLSSKLLQLRFRIQNSRISSMQVIVLAFATIILIGAGLLCLPIASRTGESCGFLKALFTATSATCVTGLILADTYVQWTGFGQLVILTMIQIGGLGFMSIVSIFAFSFRKKFGLRERLLLAQAMSLNDMEDVVRLQKHVLVGSFTFEGLGAIILFCRFIREYDFWHSLKWGVFHAISGFCNAGFDILGELQPGSSMALFHTDPVVCLTMVFLVSVGGLGFFVWEEIWQVLRAKKWKGLSVYSRLVLMISGVLLASGMIVTCLLEWNNPNTLGPLSTGDKLLAALFQSMTLRTAGFAGIDQGLMTESGKAASVIYMLIGGSSGSTAGGLKTVTVGVLLLATIASARGKTTVQVFKRSISDQQIRDAMSLVISVLVLCFVGAIVITTDSGTAFLDSLFETASALATVGLTADITPTLGVLSKLIIIAFMFFGRVGLLTISLGFLVGDRAAERFHYAETKLMIG